VRSEDREDPASMCVLPLHVEYGAVACMLAKAVTRVRICRRRTDAYMNRDSCGKRRMTVHGVPKVLKQVHERARVESCTSTRTQ
jgi:hypothetical protein